MSSYYVAKTAGCIYFFYRTEADGLQCRIWAQGRLSPEICLLKQARPYFTVTLNRGEPYIFCQDGDGGLWVITERDGQWHNRAMRLTAEKNMNDTEAANADSPYSTQHHDILITPMITDQGVSIVYNTLSLDGTAHYLLTRQANESGGWLPASRIDRFQPLNHALYEAQATSREHMLLFYQTRSTENQLGYREITPTRFGAYQRFYNAAGTVVDTAYLTTHDAVHVLYVVKTLFSSQLLYRRKTDSAFGTPILLWEAPRIDQCLLSFVYDNLYATCMIGGQLYAAVSENSGDSFSRMNLYKRKFCYDPVKAVYLSAIPLTENEMYIRQLYVDRNAPWDVQMIPDLYDRFYRTVAPEPIDEKPPAAKESLRDMQERLTLAERQLEERDKQIMSLMMKIKTGAAEE